MYNNKNVATKELLEKSVLKCNRDFLWFPMANIFKFFSEQYVGEKQL